MPDATPRAIPTLRFAPSPNGRLHLGHAYSALLNDAVARRLGGRWLLRIEDIDPTRANAETIAGVEDDLAWLGLDWPRPVRRQSEHMAEYAAAGQRLRAARLLFPCFCTRGKIAAAIAALEADRGEPWPRDPDGTPLYPGTCRHVRPTRVARRIEAGEPHAWRLDMATALARSRPVSWRSFDPDGGSATRAAQPERWGDVVVVRKEAPTSYHLSVVLDDAAQGVTHVVRGADVEAATDIHALLAACLGVATPLYHHHRLLTDAAGQKLSKSRNAYSLAAMREVGETARSIRDRLGFA